MSEQLLQLADSYKIKTLFELCDYAQREMTMTQLMNLAVLTEPYQDPAISEISEFKKKDWYLCTHTYRPMVDVCYRFYDLFFNFFGFE